MRITFSAHARQRMRHRRIPEDAVREVLSEPHTSYEGTASSQGRAWVFIGRCSSERDAKVVVRWPQTAPGDWYVVTCAWRDEE